MGESIAQALGSISRSEAYVSECEKGIGICVYEKKKVWAQMKGQRRVETSTIQSREVKNSH